MKAINMLLGQPVIKDPYNDKSKTSAVADALRVRRKKKLDLSKITAPIDNKTAN